MRDQFENLLQVKNNCSDLTQLSKRIRLPNPRYHKKTWEETPFQERMAEVVQILSNLVEDVSSNSTSIPSVCGSVLLKMLEHNAKNYLQIMTQLSVVEPFFPTTKPLQNSKKLEYSSDLGDILNHFDRVLRGKLEMLIRKLEEVHCP